VFVFIENWEFFSLATKMPKPIAELLKEIEHQTMIEKNPVHKKLLVKIGRRILWKWSEAAFNYTYYNEMQREGMDDCL
jgi:hypothetical protein